jgi:hypothetical protein
MTTPVVAKGLASACPDGGWVTAQVLCANGGYA